MSILMPTGALPWGRGECFVTCDCYSIRGDTLGGGFGLESRWVS